MTPEQADGADARPRADDASAGADPPGCRVDAAALAQYRRGWRSSATSARTRRPARSGGLHAADGEIAWLERELLGAFAGGAAPSSRRRRARRLQPDPRGHRRHRRRAPGAWASPEPLRAHRPSASTSPSPRGVAGRERVGALKNRAHAPAKHHSLQRDARDLHEPLTPWAGSEILYLGLASALHASEDRLDRLGHQVRPIDPEATTPRLRAGEARYESGPC